jgi:hypothetical protein
LDRTIYPSFEFKLRERKTFILHLISQIFSGVATGILILQDIILKKSLGSSDFDVTILIYLISTSFLVSIYGAEIINRATTRSKTILTLGIIGRTPLLLIPFFESKFYYIGAIAFSSYIDAMLLPVWNIVFRHNYSTEKRSSLFSYASSLQTVMLLIITTLFGFFLDKNDTLYKYIFPMAGIFGMLCYFNLSRMMKLVPDSQEHKSIAAMSVDLKTVKEVLILPLKNTLRICKENKPFFRFEVYFFLYGMAFMIMSVAIPLFLVEQLKLDYTPISLARGLIFHSAHIIFTPLMGKLQGSGHPAKFTGLIFISLMLFPLTLIFAGYLGDDGLTDLEMFFFYACFFIFGIGMSGITISWALGSIFYAPEYEVSNYQAVHVTLTGVRGLFAPLVGYLIIRIFSIEINLVISALLFALAGLMMIKESRLKYSYGKL